MVTHMKTTVEISDPLLREAKRAAQRDGTTLRELIEVGLRRVLDDRAAIGRKRYELPDLRNRRAQLQPWIREGDWSQLRDLVYGLDVPEDEA